MAWETDTEASLVCLFVCSSLLTFSCVGVLPVYCVVEMGEEEVIRVFG